MPRVKSTVEIVSSNEILTDEQILDEVFTIGRITRVEDKIKWCVKHRLLKNTYKCTSCRNRCSFVKSKSSIDGKEWTCSRCKTRKSIRTGSFFQNSHLKLEQLIIIIIGWAIDMPQYHIADEAECSNGPTIVDWMNILREECGRYLFEHPQEIGGMDENGLPIEVEVDESEFFHRKYRGKWREGHWVFGGIERKSRKCFFVEVPNRTEETLRDITNQWILPGTHIISDGWTAYQSIEDWFCGIFTHEVVTRDSNLVRPDDPNVHAQNVEKRMRSKRKLRRQLGTSRDLFSPYFHEFVWRQSVPKRKICNHILIMLSKHYRIS